MWGPGARSKCRDVGLSRRVGGRISLASPDSLRALFRVQSPNVGAANVGDAAGLDGRCSAAR